MAKFDFVIAPAELADAMIRDLGNGPTSINGDRSSGYFRVAKEADGDGEITVALIENKAFLKREEQFYAIHLIDDISMSDCELIVTDSLDADEVVDTLEDVYTGLKKRLTEE